MNRKYPVYLLYAVTFILAACSLLYELLIAQAISSLANNTVIWYSLTIGFYLGAMGTGALLCNKLYGKKQKWASLFQVEILLSLAGGASVLIIYIAHMLLSYLWVRNFFLAGLTAFYLSSFLMIIAAGFLTGLELPLLIQIGKELSKEKRITNRILGADYFGSLIGGVAFPLLLLPYMELLTISLVTASLNLAVAFLLFAVFIKNKQPYTLRLAVSGFLVLMFIAGFARLGALQQYFLKKYYYYTRITKDIPALFSGMKDYPPVERFSSPYQKIDIVKTINDNSPIASLINTYSSKYHRDPDYPHNYLLFLDGAFQVWTNFEEMYHEYFAHVPVILNGRVPREVLVLGAGDGLLVRELVKYPEIESITVVELDKKVAQLAKTHPVLSRANKGSFEDPRVNIIIADGYHYVRKDHKIYDAIYIDFPDPNDYHLSKLYSQEFYSFIGKHLNTNGYAVLNAPRITILAQENMKNTLPADPFTDWEIYYNTLRAAGFKTIIPYISVLETDNKAARDIVSKAIGDTYQLVVRESNITGDKTRIITGKEAIITQLLDDFQKDQQQRFIMVKKEKEDMKGAYKDPGIELYVLNKQRFSLAIDMPFSAPQGTNPQKVNSIMKPRIPDTSFWWRVRIPY